MLLSFNTTPRADRIKAEQRRPGIQCGKQKMRIDLDGESIMRAFRSTLW